jgi:hypothetical protein
MGGKDYNVDFVCRNFQPSMLEPKKVWKEMKDEYVVLQREYELTVNESLGPLNDLWKTLNPHEEEDEIDEEDEAVRYSYYLHDSLSTLAYIVAQHHKSYYLSPFVFYGKEGPQFACRIKEHPELWITHQEKKK